MNTGANTANNTDLGSLATFYTNCSLYYGLECVFLCVYSMYLNKTNKMIYKMMPFSMLDAHGNTL